MALLPSVNNKPHQWHKWRVCLKTNKQKNWFKLITHWLSLNHPWNALILVWPSKPLTSRDVNMLLNNCRAAEISNQAEPLVWLISQKKLREKRRRICGTIRSWGQLSAASVGPSLSIHNPTFCSMLAWRRETYDLFCSQTPGGGKCVSASLFRNCHVVDLFYFYFLTLFISIWLNQIIKNFLVFWFSSLEWQMQTTAPCWHGGLW